MTKKYSPIAYFVFNRPKQAALTLSALAANTYARQSDITIFCDAPRTDAEKSKTDAVRKIAHTSTGFASVTVIERDKNMGCAASVIDALARTFAKHDRIIVIEDDILTSPYTLKFLNEGLEFYKDNTQVFNISAWSPPHRHFKIPDDYKYDVYAVQRFNCWGWASWRDRFTNIDWDVSDYSTFKNSPQARKAFNAGGEDLSTLLDMQQCGKIDGWDIRADYHRFKNKQIGINPAHSFVKNIGLYSGTHFDKDTVDIYNEYKINNSQNISFIDDIRVVDSIAQNYRRYFSPYRDQTFLTRLKGYIRNLLS